MAAKTLVQALEGVSFPCDRSQLIEYARRSDLGGQTLAALEGIPERQYRDLREVFTALPGRPQPQPQPQQEASAPGEEFPPPVPAVMEWWMNGWRQVLMPWDVTAQCLRSSAEAWPQWLRLTRHLWFPWSK